MVTFVTAKGFTKAIGYIDNLPISNVLYSYDAKKRLNNDPGNKTINLTM